MKLRGQLLRLIYRTGALLNLALALIVTLPVHAWEVSIGAICTLRHETAEASVLLTYDPSLPEYSITLGRTNAAWSDGPVFALHFFGLQPNQITTDRHRLSEKGAALTVTDRGFSNVLDGLQFNETVTAHLGDQTLSIPLDGAGPAVEDFRACVDMPLA